MQLVCAHACGHMGGAALVTWFISCLLISCDVTAQRQESKRLYLSDLAPQKGSFSKTPRMFYRVDRPPLPAKPSFSRVSCNARGQPCFPWGTPCCPGMVCTAANRGLCLKGSMGRCSCRPLGKRFSTSSKDAIWYR